MDDPFSRFSAEEEIDYLNNIYVNPRYYNTIFKDINIVNNYINSIIVVSGTIIFGLLIGIPALVIIFEEIWKLKKKTDNREKA